MVRVSKIFPPGRRRVLFDIFTFDVLQHGGMAAPNPDGIGSLSEDVNSTFESQLRGV